MSHSLAMDRIRHFADLSIRRGCGFGLLAITTMMVGVSYEVLLAVKLGALALTFMGVVLLLKGLQATRRNFKHTELWILLERRHDLPDAHAQHMIGGLLRDLYFRYAEFSAIGAFLFWGFAFALWLVR